MAFHLLTHPSSWNPVTCQRGGNSQGRARESLPAQPPALAGSRRAVSAGGLRPASSAEALGLFPDVQFHGVQLLYRRKAGVRGWATSVEGAFVHLSIRPFVCSFTRQTCMERLPAPGAVVGAGHRLGLHDQRAGVSANAGVCQKVKSAMGTAKGEQAGGRKPWAGPQLSGRERPERRPDGAEVSLSTPGPGRGPGEVLTQVLGVGRGDRGWPRGQSTPGLACTDHHQSDPLEAKMPNNVCFYPFRHLHFIIRPV